MAIDHAGRARAFKAALVVVKPARGRVPGAAHIDHEVCRGDEGLVAGTQQGVRWENPHQNAHAENVVGVESATVGGDAGGGSGIGHGVILNTKNNNQRP